MSFRPPMCCALGGFLVIAPGAYGGASALAQQRSDAPDPRSPPLVGDEASRLDLGVGAFDVQGDRGARPSAVGQVEFRYGKKLFFIGPAVGILATTKGAIFGYGGIYADFRFGPFVVTPLGAVGGYHQGGGEDLGGPFQFRASIAASYEFANQSRLGAQIAHVSNGGTDHLNPGPNEVLLTYAIPLPW
jgi:lipid A 3-O-deacylase